MEREKLYYALNDQQKEFEEEDPFVIRDALNKLKKLLPLKLPIIITGVRRCGKSFLMKQIKNEFGLKEKQYLYVNFNDERLTGFGIDDFQKIVDFLVENNYFANCFLFLDEIQEVSGWEKWVDRIRTRFSIFLTGSNSKLLSSEISTSLTGRSLNISLFPFSFKECLSAKKIDYSMWKTDSIARSKVRSNVEDYLTKGGFPLYVLTGQEILLKELYENILYRDIIRRFGKNEKLMRELSSYFLSNPSSKVSIRNISDYIQVKNRKIVKEYITAFEKAFVYFFISKFDYSVKKQIQNPQKLYCIDNGFLSTLGFQFSRNNGKLVENLVAIELKRRGKETYYYNDNKECDFVIRKGNKIVEAIQATWHLTKDNKDREIGGLMEAMDKLKVYEGLILTYDQEDSLNIEGRKILVKPIWKWLLEENKEDSTYF